MKLRITMLSLTLALGLMPAQTTPPQTTPPPQSAPDKTQQATTPATPADTKTAPAEMKTSAFKGVLVDPSCSSSNCPVSATSAQLGMKLDDGKVVRFDLVGIQRAQDELKNNKRWGKDLSANKPIHAKVLGVLSGDKLIVSSIN
jgi:hypothetical protein